MPLYDDNGDEVTPDQAAAYLQQLQQQPPQQQGRPFVRDLESRLTATQQERDTEKARADAAERELGFVKAGVPLDHPMSTYFMAGYQGDTTPDAIRAKAAEIGLIQPPQQQTPVPQAQQADAFQRMAQAVDGGVTPAQRNFDAEIAAAPDRATAHRLLEEKNAIHGKPGVPAIVNE